MTAKKGNVNKDITKKKMERGKRNIRSKKPDKEETQVEACHIISLRTEKHFKL